MLLQEEFEKRNVRIDYINSPTPTTPEEQFAQHFQGVFAEYERAQIVERSRRGRIYKAKQGDVSVFARIPYGYKRFKDGHRAVVEIDENQSRIIKEIFNLYTEEDYSLAKICRNLESRSIYSPTGVTWNRSTLMRLLKNSVYIGLAYYGKTEKIKAESQRIIRRNGKSPRTAQIQVKKKPRELWYEIPFPRIIEDEQFQKAQEKLETNRQLSQRNTKELSLLQGLVVCEICGLPFYKKSRGSNGRKKTYYCCRSLLESGISSCTNRKVRVDMLDKVVWKNILTLLQNPGLIESEVQRRIHKRPEILRLKNKRCDIERSLKKLNKAKDKLLDAYQSGDCLTLDDLRKRMSNIGEQIRLLERDLKAIEAVEIQGSDRLNEEEVLNWFKEQLDKSSRNLSLTERRKIVRLLVEEIRISKESIKIQHCIPLDMSSRNEGLLCCVSPRK